MKPEILLFICAAFAMCVGCLVPNRCLPPLPNDKFLHFAGFAVLTVLALHATNGREQALWWLAGLFVGGYLLECLQSMVPDRHFCWRDLAANATGIVVVTGLAFATGHF